MVRQLLARCRALWASRSKESELDEEIRFHLAEEAADRVTGGVAPEQAIAAARRDFGNVVLVREATREVWGWGVAERSIGGRAAGGGPPPPQHGHLHYGHSLLLRPLHR